MNQKQREYAIGRVEALRNKRIKALEEKYITPAKRPTGEEKAAAIRAGKVKMKAQVKRVAEYTYVENLFDFSVLSTEEKRHPDLDKYVEAERERARKVIDQIMLGDASEALELIADYEDSKTRAVRAA